MDEQSNLHLEVTAIAPKSLTTFFCLLKAKSSDLVFEDIDDDLDQELGHLTLGIKGRSIQSNFHVRPSLVSDHLL